MQLSAEVRWFQVGPIPDDLRKWFQQPAAAFQCPVGGGRDRKDVYLRIAETELSIKSRGGKKGLEVKGLVEVLPAPVAFGRVAVAPQIFCKWSSEQLAFEKLSTVETVKTRWMRKFDTATEPPREIALGAGAFAEDPAVKSERPDVGCNVELTKVVRDGETWWTFGAESFAFNQSGRPSELVVEGLLRTMHALSLHGDVDLRTATYRGYGEWIAMK